MLGGGVLQAPRRVAAIRPGAKEAQRVAVGIAEMGLAPKPRLIARLGDERHPGPAQARHRPIDVAALEVHDDARLRHVRDPVERERRAPDRALEARVVGKVGDDLAEPEVAVERDTARDVGRRQRDLVEVHRGRL